MARDCYSTFLEPIQVRSHNMAFKWIFMMGNSVLTVSSSD